MYAKTSVGERSEATPGSLGKCRSCDIAVIPKCGEKNTCERITNVQIVRESSHITIISILLNRAWNNKILCVVALDIGRNSNCVQPPYNLPVESILI